MIYSDLMTKKQLLLLRTKSINVTCLRAAMKKRMLLTYQRMQKETADGFTSGFNFKAPSANLKAPWGSKAYVESVELGDFPILPKC